MNPDQSSLVLSPEDYNFIERVINDITEDNMLPFSFPPGSIPRVIKKSAFYFFENYDDAVEERYIRINYSDIVRDSTLNAVIQLPQCIQEVGQVWTVNGTGITMTSPLTFMKDPLLYGGALGAINAISGYGNGGGFYGGMGNADRTEIYELGLVSMFAYAQDKTLFTKGIAFSYNPFSHKLNIQGKPEGHLVFRAYQRIPLQDLYQSTLFFDHVRASVMERLKKILSMMDFQYPGDVKINFDEIEKQGTTLREKVEADVKESSSGRALFMMT